MHCKKTKTNVCNYRKIIGHNFYNKNMLIVSYMVIYSRPNKIIYAYYNMPMYTFTVE